MGEDGVFFGLLISALLLGVLIFAAVIVAVFLLPAA